MRYIGTKIGSSIDTCGITPVVNGVLSVKGSDVTKAAVVPVGPALKTQECQWNSAGPMNLGYDFNVQTDSTLPPDGWSMANGAWGTNALWSTNAQTGGHSLQIPSQSAPFVGSYGLVSGYVPITDSQSLRLVAMVSTSYDSSTTNFPFTFTLTWYDGSKAATGSATNWTPKGVTANSWAQRTTTASAPSGARYVTITVSDHGTTAGIKYADYVMLLDAGSAIPSSSGGGSSGSTFPTVPNTNDRFFRSDLGLDCYYDGTRWLTVEEYTVPLVPYAALPSSVSTSNTNVLLGRIPDSPSGTVYLTKWTLFTNVSTTNSSTSFWTLALKNDAASTIDSFGTSGDTIGASTDHVRTVNSVRTTSTDHYWFINATKSGITGTPGPLAIAATVHCRLIVT